MDFEIVGGVYQEYCSRPEHDTVQGSAGRAAYCLGLLDREINVKLHARMADSEKAKLTEHFAFLSNFDFQFYKVGFTVKFDYFHPLSEPQIFPSPSSGKLPVFEPTVSKGATTLVVRSLWGTK